MSTRMHQHNLRPLPCILIYCNTMVPKSSTHRPCWLFCKPGILWKWHDALWNGKTGNLRHEYCWNRCWNDFVSHKMRSIGCHLTIEINITFEYLDQLTRYESQLRLANNLTLLLGHDHFHHISLYIIIGFCIMSYVIRRVCLFVDVADFRILCGGFVIDSLHRTWPWKFWISFSNM